MFLLSVLFYSSCDRSTEEYDKNIKRAKGAISTADFERAIKILDEYKAKNGSSNEIDSLILYSSKLILYRDSAQRALNVNLSSIDSIENANFYQQNVNIVISSSLCNGKSNWLSQDEILVDLEKLKLISEINEQDKKVMGFDVKSISSCQNSIQKIRKNMRRSFFNIFNKEAWIENIDVKLQNENNDHLVLIGLQFYDNKGKLEGYENIKEILQKLEFKKVTFKGGLSDTGHVFSIID